MKKLYLFLFPIFILTISFSCTKKSPNDPIVSLLTRNQRITGEWKLVSYNLTSIYTYSGGQTSTEEINFDGGIRTIIISSPWSGNTETRQLYSKYVQFKNDGTWVIDENMEDVTTGQTSNKQTNGDWVWTNSNNKKTGLNLYGYDAGFWPIEKLSNQKLITSYSATRTISDSAVTINSFLENAEWEKQ